MESPNTFNPLQPLLFALAVLIVRYTVISGGFYYLFWVRYKNKFWSRRIQKDARALAIPLFEIKYSLISFLCSALFAILIAWVGSKGGLRIYRNIDEFGWGYFFGSIFISFIIHDTYFYWMHRGLHSPWLYKRFHAVHHASTNPTPLAAFSFHPGESFLEAFFLLPLVAFLPLHPAALFTFLSMSHLVNAYGHLGVELFPRGSWDSWNFSWLNTSTHHNLHHQHFRQNYSLYFRAWDLMCGTADTTTEKTFRALTEKNEKARA